MICPYCGEKFSYPDNAKECESAKVLPIPKTTQKKFSAKLDNIMNKESDIANSWWVILWLMGTVLLSILFVSELMEVIEASSGYKLGSGVLGKVWLFFAIKWACRVFFTSCVFIIGKRTVK